MSEDESTPSLDLVGLARRLRAGGAPVTIDDVADATRGLARLGTSDVELVAGVLEATLGKYGRGVPDDFIVELARDETNGRGSADLDGERDGLTRPRAAEGDQSDGAVDENPSAAPALGDQAAERGAAHEDEIALGLDPPGGQQWSLDLEDRTRGPRARLRRWSPPPHVRVGESPDLRAIASAVRPLLAQWDGAPSRPRPARRGRIDLTRSVRRAVQTGGSILPPARRRRGRSRPTADIVVDLSPSVRESAALPVAVAHVLARSGRRLRVFAATDRLTEVTAAFRRRDVHAGLSQLIATGALDPTVGSDWGRVFSQLERRQSPRPGRRHVLIFGDGRSVGTDPGIGLHRIVDRARSVRWATPEPEGAWHLGAGEPARWAELVDRMVTVRTTADLAVLSAAEAPGRAGAHRN